VTSGCIDTIASHRRPSPHRYRLGNIARSNAIVAVIIEVSDRARHRTRPHRSAGTQCAGRKGDIENLRRSRIRHGVTVELLLAEHGITRDTSRLGKGTSGGHAAGDGGGGLTASGVKEGLGCGSIDMNHDIEPVQKRTRHPPGISGS
jgi:hypothetical protein